MTAPPAAPRRRRDELEREPDPRQDWFAVGIWYGTMAAITWPRTRGPATLGLAVLLTRVLGARAKRLEDTVAYLFRQRAGIVDEVDELDADFARARELINELRQETGEAQQRLHDLELVAAELAGEHVRENSSGPLRLLGVDVNGLDPAIRAALERVRDRALPF